MSGLPEGWAAGKLGELFKFAYGKALPAQVRDGCGYPVFGSNGVVGHHSEPLTQGETIIIGRKGSIGEVNYSETPCSPIDTTYYIDQFHGMPSRYWFHLLQTLNLSELNKSTAIPGLSRGDAYQLEVAISPLPEQTRIADKLDALLARMDAARERLDRVPALLKRFRQSVLAAATSGELTEEWRGGEGDAWEETTIGHIAVDLRYGTSKKCDYRNDGTAVLRIPNIAEHARISSDDLKRAEFDASEAAKLRLEAGDLLVIRSNGSVDLVGKTAIVTSAEVGLLFAGYLMRLRLQNGKVLPRYAYYSLSSPAQRHRIEIASKSTSGVNNINSEELRSLPISLPPLDEQHEITRRVEALFALADKVQTQYEAARARVDKLTPALLAKAFRGELVPQDPNDEPASVLLQRLRATQGDAKPVAKRGRRARAT